MHLGKRKLLQNFFLGLIVAQKAFCYTCIYTVFLSTYYLFTFVDFVHIVSNDSVDYHWLCHCHYVFPTFRQITESAYDFFPFSGYEV